MPDRNHSTLPAFGGIPQNAGQLSTSLIDTHCHLNHPDFYGDLADVLHRAEESGVRQVVCVGYDLESSELASRLAREIKMISAAVGIHPHDAATFTAEAEERIRELAADREHVVAIGETGLDYYRDLSPRDVQQDAYRRHIELAREMGLPLIVHSREAGSDVLGILGEQGLPTRGVVMHCLPSDRDFAARAIELGCYVGIAGPITFRNADSLREIARELPPDRVLLETDAPYLTPHPYRGRRNESAYLPLVAASLAESLGMTPDEIAAATTANARKLFGL
jgi:TatD DNase family protein